MGLRSSAEREKGRYGSPSQIISSIACAYIPRHRPGTKIHGWEKGTPRTVGMPYRWVSLQNREGRYGHGIPGRFS